MPNSNFFLKATLTDKTSSAEDTLRVLCEYTDPADTPVVPPTTSFNINPGNNFIFTIDGVNIIRFIPNSNISSLSVSGLDIDLGATGTLSVLGIAFPEVGSAPALPTPASKTIIYNGINIGQISYDSSSIGNGSALTFSLELDGEISNPSVEIPALPYITIA